MKKALTGTVFTVPLLISGSLCPISGLLYPTSITKVYRSDIMLTSGDGIDSNDALVLIPAEDAEFANAANALYLEPNGFDGTATVFLTPHVGSEVAKLAPGVQALVHAIEADYTAGDLSAADPLYAFGYSEGAVEEGLAEQQLAADGIPSSDLNFVMVGDSASAEGGFLNTVIDSLPESWQQPTTELFAQLGVTPPLLGATTPDNLYPTEVYSLSGDGWANWDDGANTYGMFTEHLEYLGLTPAEIASATETTDGLTNYFTIDSANVNNLAALYHQLLLGLDIAPSNVTTATTTAAADAVATPAAASTDTAASAATTGADPATLLSEATTNYTDANQMLAELPSGGDYAANVATVTQFQDMLLQAIGNVGSAQSAIATGSATDETTAVLGLIGPEYQALGPALQSEFVDVAAHLLTGGDFTSAADLAAGVDPVSAIDPGIFADLLSSIGL